MVNKRRIYQIYCGRWEQANLIDHQGTVLERMAGMDWQNLATKLGFEAVYLLGLWDVTGPVVVNWENDLDLTAVPHRCPSAFAIVDHTKVYPKLGNEADLINLVQAMHQAGLSVCVDLVANHTGLSHPWRQTNPLFYKPGTAFSGDVAELNYDNPEVWLSMIGIAKTLVGYGIDGFRCDMAHLVYSEFWQQLIRIVKASNPQCYFIAEAYGQDIFDQSARTKLLAAGFDSVYDGGLHQNLRQLAGGAPLSDLAGHLNFVIGNTPNQWTHYGSNHDDPFPLAAELFWPVLCLISVLPGNLFLFNGSLGGFLGRLAHHYIQLLPQEFTENSQYPGLGEWAELGNRPDLRLEEFTSIDNAYLRTKWTTADQSGSLLFNFSGQERRDEVSGARLDPYQTLIVRDSQKG